MLAQQLKKLIGLQLRLTRRPQPSQGKAQIWEFAVELSRRKIALAGHNFGKPLPPLPLLHRIGSQHRLAAQTPGPPSREQLGQGRTQGNRFSCIDPQIKGHRRLAQAHKHLQQFARPQHRSALVLHGQGGGFQGRHQLGAVGQALAQTVAQAASKHLAGQQLINTTKGQEHLRAGGGQLAVAQH